MRILRESSKIAALAVAATLAACATVKNFNETPAAGVDLTGTWKLNRGASDDPAQLFARDRDREERQASEHRRGPTDDDDPIIPEDRGRRGGGGNGGEGERREMREQHSPAEFMGDLGTGRGLLRISQRREEIVIDNGVRTRRFIPGSASVVSVPGGVADQSAGFDGREFVINTGGRNRPEILERYSLSPDRKQLTVKVKIIGHGQMKNVEWKRVYDTTPDDTLVDGPST